MAALTAPLQSTRARLAAMLPKAVVRMDLSESSETVARARVSPEMGILIGQILEYNRTVSPAFLQQFNLEELCAYRDHLIAGDTPGSSWVRAINAPAFGVETA